MGPEKQLNAYLRACQGQPFAWGSHDCLTFTNGAYRAIFGVGWADDWLGRYMVDGRPMRKDELRREFGYSTIQQAIDERLTRVDGVPPKGALVTSDHVRRWVTGVALGICVGTRAAFLDRTGVIYLPIETTRERWVKHAA
jgi:hypothetical protein